jgi:hypothetical protein
LDEKKKKKIVKIQLLDNETLTDSIKVETPNGTTNEGLLDEKHIGIEVET